VTGAEAQTLAVAERGARWEAHHQEAGLRVRDRPRHGRRGQGEDELAEVLLVQRHAVRAVVAGVGAGAELGADGHLGREADHRHADAVRDERRDGVVDIARVAGQQGAVNNKNLARAVGRRVEERRAAHLQRVLEARVPLRLLLAELLEPLEVLAGVPADVADAHRDAVAHADDAQLRDGVLLKVLGDEFRGVAEREEVARGTEVLLRHGEGEVEDQDQMPDDASLQGRCIS